MRILVAPDKFKGSLGAEEVARQIAAGLREELPAAEIIERPIADGGEGTAAVICRARGGEWRSVEVQDAAGAYLAARYCTIADGRTAVLEMCAASGLWRIAPERRDALTASSFGTGELLREAARRGAQEIIVGLGGSATNDGGFGLARALGFRFLDRDGAEMGDSVLDLLRLERIAAPNDLSLPRIIAAADVGNPLLGPRGATRVFGAQKGVRPEQVSSVEAALTRLADVAARDLGKDERDAFGAGAAGGVGFALRIFCKAEVRAGFEVVAELIDLEAAVRTADVVITGEGRLDAQTLEGKAPAGLARLARQAVKPVHAIVGEMEETPGLRELFDSICVLTGPRDEAMTTTPELLRSSARDLAAQLRA